MRVCLTLLCLLIVSPALAADPVFPTGSRVGLVPPSGMVRSVEFPGFVDADKKVAILVGEFPGEAYGDVEKGLEATALKPGFSVESREPISLPDRKGLLIVGRVDDPAEPLRRWLLAAQVGEVTALVSVEAHGPLGAGTEANVRAALDSITVRATVPNEEQLSVLPYTLKDLAGFRIVQATPAGGALLTDGPKNAIDLVEQPVVLITIIPSVPEQGADRGSFARMALSGVGGVRDMHIQSMEPMRIGGQQGHETMLHAKDARSDTDLTIIQWLRFGMASSVRLLAVARRDQWSAMYPRFRTLRDGFEAR